MSAGGATATAFAAPLPSLPRPLPGTPPGRHLLALGAVVLCAHFLLLEAAPAAMSLDNASQVRHFVTRTITINAPAGPAPTTPEIPAAGAAHAAPPQAPRPARAAAPAPQPVTAADPPVQRVAEALSVPAPAPAPTPAQSTPPAQAPSAPQSTPAPASSTPVLSTPAPPTHRDDARHATAFSIPGSIKLNYNVTGEVKKQAWNARGELLWRHDGTQYEARSEVSAFLAGSRVQTSAGRLTAEGLAPTRYSDKSRTETAAHFDRERGRIVFSVNTPDAPLLAGAQDRLSVFLQLAAMIAAEPAKYPPATSITLQTAGPREADTWVFAVEAEEKLNLPAGETPALKLTRKPRKDFDVQVEIWLAPALGYLPARMRLTQQNGDYVDQQLRSTDKP